MTTPTPSELKSLRELTQSQIDDIGWREDIREAAMRFMPLLDHISALEARLAIAEQAMEKIVYEPTSAEADRIMGEGSNA